MMGFRLAFGFLALACLGWCAQTQTQTPPAASPCAGTPAYSSCELLFELSDADAAKHPHPYTTVELSVNFRSPRQHSYILPAFWDGGRRMVVRFSPVEGGQ